MTKRKAQLRTLCDCGGSLQSLDTNQNSTTAQCMTCRQCYLIIDRTDLYLAIPLRDFHLKRGEPPTRRPLHELGFATRLVQCLQFDTWPSPATVIDYGIVTSSHLGALQFAVGSGITAYDLDRVMGDGPAITRLTSGVPGQPYDEVTFETFYDRIDWSEETAEL